MIKDIDERQADIVLQYLIDELGEEEVASRVTDAMQDITRDEADGFDSVNGWSPYLEEGDEYDEDELAEMFDEHCVDIFGDSRIDYTGVTDEFWNLLQKCDLEFDNSFLASALVSFREGLN